MAPALLIGPRQTDTFRCGMATTKTGLRKSATLHAASKSKRAGKVEAEESTAYLQPLYEADVDPLYEADVEEPSLLPGSLRSSGARRSHTLHNHTWRRRRSLSVDCVEVIEAVEEGAGEDEDEDDDEEEDGGPVLMRSPRTGDHLGSFRDELLKRKEEASGVTKGEEPTSKTTWSLPQAMVKGKAAGASEADFKALSTSTASAAAYRRLDYTDSTRIKAEPSTPPVALLPASKFSASRGPHAGIDHSLGASESTSASFDVQTTPKESFWSVKEVSHKQKLVALEIPHAAEELERWTQEKRSPSGDFEWMISRTEESPHSSRYLAAARRRRGTMRKAMTPDGRHRNRSMPRGELSPSAADHPRHSSSTEKQRSQVKAATRAEEDDGDGVEDADACATESSDPEAHSIEKVSASVEDAGVHAQGQTDELLSDHTHSAARRSGFSKSASIGCIRDPSISASSEHSQTGGEVQNPCGSGRGKGNGLLKFALANSYWTKCNGKDNQFIG